MPAARAALLRTLRVLVCALAMIGSVLVAPAAVVAEPPPPRPITTNSDDARAAAAAADAAVARAQKRVQAQLATLRDATRAADRAEAAYQAQLLVQTRAQQVAILALIRAARADATFFAANRELQMVVTQQYESGGLVVDTGHLLVADDPSAVLSVLTTQRQIGDYQNVLVTRAMTARDASVAAHHAADAAFHAVEAAADQLKSLRDTAISRRAAAHAGLVRLQTQLKYARTSQAEANAVLSLFLGGWTIADPARAAALNAQYVDLAAQMRGKPMAAPASTWNPAMGRSAVWRALQAIGTPYAWAGGGTSGPSRGVCAKGDAHLDCHKVGFDCSGLMMYGWAPYLSLPHYAATQWSAGHLHPAPSELQPGDLVFWSNDKTVKGIHHVAMYVGDGNVLQAPNSGDIVRITPLDNVAAGYYGATRPLT